MSFSKRETFKWNRRGRMVKIQYMSVNDKDCHSHFVNNQHISWQWVSFILIFPTALYYINIADIVYMHVSMVTKQNFITRVCKTKIFTCVVCILLAIEVTVLPSGVDCWVTLSKRYSYRLSQQFSSTDILKTNVCWSILIAPLESLCQIWSETILKPIKCGRYTEKTSNM